MKRFLVAASALGLLALPATAADMAPYYRAPPPIPVLGWTGLYVGGDFGYGMGGFGPGTNPILGQAVIFPSTLTGFVGGLQAGYNFQLSNNVVLGLETDMSFPSPIDRAATGVTPFNTTVDYFGTARARIGYAFGSILPYVTGGLALGQTKVNINDTDGNLVASKSAQVALLHLQQVLPLEHRRAVDDQSDRVACGAPDSGGGAG